MSQSDSRVRVFWSIERETFLSGISIQYVSISITFPWRFINKRKQHVLDRLSCSRIIYASCANFSLLFLRGKFRRSYLVRGWILCTLERFIAPIGGALALETAKSWDPWDKAASIRGERREIEENEHVGEGWRALQDVSKVKLKVSCSLSLCVACICMTIVHPRVRARLWLAISFDLGPWSLRFGFAKWSLILRDGCAIVEITSKSYKSFATPCQSSRPDNVTL